METFQSSPSPKAGSYALLCANLISFHSFNPLPARRPGATGTHSSNSSPVEVSILSQPEGRELRCKVVGAVQHPGFNPLPARRPGATFTEQQPRTFRPCFNPLPARRPGATGLSAHFDENLMFQSSPSPKAGSYVLPSRTNHGPALFQSSPSPKAGSYPLHFPHFPA